MYMMGPDYLTGMGGPGVRNDNGNVQLISLLWFWMRPKKVILFLIYIDCRVHYEPPPVHAHSISFFFY